jgi:hypothetical protein
MAPKRTANGRCGRLTDAVVEAPGADKITPRGS